MRVLVSGAGIAGPTLAWFLARTGARTTIFEKSHALLPHGQNVDITGSAVTLIKKMGLMDQVRRWNTTEKGSQFIDPKGRPFAPLPLQEGRGASFTSEFEILRGDLAAVLYKATKDHPNVKYKFNTTVKSVISNNDDSVMVESSNGEVQEFDLLVAADGQWSKVRKQCFPPDSVKVLDQNMYAVYWTIPRLPSDNDWWNIYLALQSRIITLRPDPHGTIRAMFTRMPRNAAQKKEWQDASRGGRKMQEELIRRDFADAGWQADRLLSSMDQAADFYFQAIQQIKMTKWSRSRVICLGDTAFCPTPLTGQGTTLAMIGGYVLAGELSKLADGEHPSKALEAYESTFRPFVEKMTEIVPIIPSFAHPEQAWKRYLFHILARTISNVAAVPWVVGRFSEKSEGGNENDFPLPQYPCFENAVSR